MGCDSSQHIQEENQKKWNEIDEGDDNEPKAQKKNDGANNEEVINKEGNKANKDNRKNKKDKRRKRDMKNQQEFRMSENDNSLSNSDTYKIKKKEKKILRSSKKRDNSDNSEEEDNKEDNSNINTEGMNTVETRKFNIKKKENEGLLIMDGVEDLIPEDLTEDDIYQLVEDALSENIVDSEDKKIPGTITRKQAKSIATILFKKLKKKKGKHNIDISDYPELKGVNVKIGAGLLTKDVIKDMMFNDDNIDQKQVDKTYAKLTKNSSDIKALTIELITNDTENENNKDEKNSEKKS